MHTNNDTLNPRVQVQIVTHNSRDIIVKCLESVFGQADHVARVVVVDNSSNDDTADLVEQMYPHVLLVRESENKGYAAGHNIGFRLAKVDALEYILTLNPDVELGLGYVSRLLEEIKTNEGVGGITGKLLRHESDDVGRRIIDSTGLVMHRFFHVRDRDAGFWDEDRKKDAENVWGVCGAAALYSMTMLKDVEHDDTVLDEVFFIYKEDVDLCWRAKRRNWIFRYVPDAVAVHRRSWTKGKRMQGLVTSHSFVNQVALLIRHVPKISVNLLLSVFVELARYLLLVATQPKVAIRIAQLMRSSWHYNWRERNRLRQRDLVKERVLNDISHIGYL